MSVKLYTLPRRHFGKDNNYRFCMKIETTPWMSFYQFLREHLPPEDNTTSEWRRGAYTIKFRTDEERSAFLIQMPTVLLE